MSFNLLTDRLDRGVRAQETIGQGFVFAQKPQQQVLSLNIRRPELAGFIPREKDDAPCFLRIAFKHIAPSPLEPPRRTAGQNMRPSPTEPLVPTTLCNHGANGFKAKSCALMLSDALRFARPWPSAIYCTKTIEFHTFRHVDGKLSIPPTCYAGNEAGATSSITPRCNRSTRLQRRAKARLWVAISEVNW